MVVPLPVGVNTTVHEPAFRVQMVTLGNPGAPVKLNMTSPVGILVVPVELSATVAVHVDAWFTNTVNVHDNAGLVLLLLTVTVPAPELAT